MRILFLSAFYPPHVIGGWEQLADDMNQALKARGHTTHVLTSDNGVDPNAPVEEPGVSRVLTLESNLMRYEPLRFLRGREQRRRANLRRLETAVAEFAPDVIFVHVMWNLWRGIPWLAERLLPGRVVYYVADDWPCSADIHTQYWQSPARHPAMRLLKRFAGPLALRQLAREARDVGLRFEQVVCVSQTVKQNLARCAGIAPERMCVIYNGIETDRFVPADGWPRNLADGPSLALLYAGSLVPTKGVHTAVEAMAILAGDGATPGITLTLAGAGHPDYEARLRAMVREFGLEQRVRFVDRVSRDAMPALLRPYDALVFPSLGEALPRIVQEAMATGLVVVGTTAGGTREILVEGETGLTFEPGDAATLARQVKLLQADPVLRVRLARAGRARVLRDFDVRRTFDDIELYLNRCASG
jgi:glycogen synthase